MFPLAIPLIAGPGACATILVLAAISRGRVEYVSILIGAVVAVLVLVYLGFRLATPIQRVLGGTGTAVITRVLSIILAALSVQLVIDGTITVIEGM